MPKATWKGAIIADAPSNQTKMVEGKVYFPPEAVHEEFLRPSSANTTCPWKGVASYYDVVVGDEVNGDAAWYPEAKEQEKHIEGFLAFWRGVQVEE